MSIVTMRIGISKTNTKYDSKELDRCYE